MGRVEVLAKEGQIAFKRAGIEPPERPGGLETSKFAVDGGRLEGEGKRSGRKQEAGKQDCSGVIRSLAVR